MIDSFYLGAYWGARHQDLETVVQHTLKILKGLENIDDQFLHFYELGDSKKQALQSMVNVSAQELERLYRKRLKKNDIDSHGYNRLGYRLSLWTGQEDGESSSLSFTAGGTSNVIGNLCLINFPYESEIKNRLLKFEKVKAIVDLIIDIWEPDRLILSSKRISQEMNDVGWLNYKRSIMIKPSPTQNIIYDSNYKNGHFFYLKTDSGMAFDYGLIGELETLKGI